MSQNFIDPQYEARVWVKATLGADAGIAAASVGLGGRIFDAPGPIPNSSDPFSDAYPFIAVDDQGGAVALGMGPSIIFDNLLLIIKTVNDSNDLDIVRPIRVAVRKALHGQSGETSVARILTCTVEQPFRLNELTGGVQYLHYGDIYRFRVQAK